MHGVFINLKGADCSSVYIGGSTLKEVRQIEHYLASYPSSRLAISKVTGQMYHTLETAPANTSPIETTLRKTKLHDCSIPEYGLIRSSVAVSLSEFVVDGFTDDDLCFETPNGRETIAWLPARAEPGRWALPHGDDVS